MLWILFSILASLTWAIVNIIDKYILTKLIRKPLIPVMVSGIIGLVASLIVFIFVGYSKLSLFNIFLSFIAGITYALMLIFYFKAVKIEEISRLVPLFYLAPFFVAFFAAVFLGEIFTPIKYFGILLLVIGSILISSKNSIKLSFGKAFWYMIFAALAASINGIITKYLLNLADFWTIFSYERIGTIIALIPLFYLNFPDLVSVIKLRSKKTIGFISLSESLNIIGILFIIIATSIGYLTLVSALSSIQPFFVLFFAVLLSRFYPKILKEEIGKSTISRKFIAIVVMFVGAILITW